jgi:hypothetical protein
VTRGDEAGLVSLNVLLCTPVFVLIVGVLFDGGSRLVAQQRAFDEAAATGRYALRTVDVSHAVGGGLRLDPATAERDAHTFLAAFGHEGTVAVKGTNVTVTARIDYRARFIGFLSGPLDGTATASPIVGVTALEP